MNGIFAAHIQSYLDFATVNGTAHGPSVWVLVAGPVLVGLLGLYAVWNVLAALVSGAFRAVGVGWRLVSSPTAGVAAPVALPHPRTEAVLVRSAA